MGRLISYLYFCKLRVLNNWKGIVEYTTPGNTGLLFSKLWALQRHQPVSQAGADELVKTSIDGPIRHGSGSTTSPQVLFGRKLIW